MEASEYLKICRNIQLLVLDVDGTLTDGGLYYGPQGEICKRFYVRDGLGIVLLQEAGLEVLLMTRSRSPIPAARARYLQLTCYDGVLDKGACLQSIAQERKMTLKAIAFMGDDIIDLPALSLAGFSACPADAHCLVRSCVMYVCAQNAGHGAVREVCDLILKAHGITPPYISEHAPSPCEIPPKPIP